VVVFGVVLGSYGHSNEVQGFLELAKHLRSNYDDVEYEAGSVILELAAEKLNVSQDVVNLLTYEEVISGNVPGNSEISKRKKGGVFYQNKYHPGVGLQQFEKDMGIMVKKETIEEVRELKGQVAYKGKVSGKVRIVLTWDEAENFQDNEILVTSMTTPDFLPIMKKAAAFVTDEGGITCHAAIVARETKKPCIIGTKVATQVLADGDEVEVDADNGVVKIISKARI
jgi:pyruvate,water dikinase